MGKGLSRSFFEKIAGPGVVAEFDRGLTVAITPKCDHDWTGPEIVIDHGSSVSCAKCGKLAIDHDMQS